MSQTMKRKKTVKRKSIPKPLSFNTTMRNPMRIASFIKCLLPYEGKILTNSLIMEIVEKIISKRLYTPIYINRTPEIKKLVLGTDDDIPTDILKEIIDNSPQNHKEAGFDKGWPSRFDTWFKLPMEFGYIFYSVGNPINISQTGHMLIDAASAEPIDNAKIQAILLNSMMKYQIDNPFRRNSNSNVPLILLLQVINLLKKDSEENNAGIFRKELSLFICWPNDDYKELYDLIKNIRSKHNYSYSDEYIYEICLDLLDATDKRNRFKISQICGELVDEYIRKMRSTGIISLRGNGRFIDFNMFEIDKINYILEEYSSYKYYNSKEDFFNYMGKIDENILNIQRVDIPSLEDIKMRTLERFATEYPKEVIERELRNLGGKRRIGSRDEVLKYIPEPTRLEFLTSIALVQNFENIDIEPNYIVDDEGLPTSTAIGGMADIVCYDDYDTLVEVTLMNGRQQVVNEMIPITRHLKDKHINNINTFALFIAPSIHDDSKRYSDWIKVDEDLDIINYSIIEFIDSIKIEDNLSDLLIRK